MPRGGRVGKARAYVTSGVERRVNGWPRWVWAGAAGVGGSALPRRLLTLPWLHPVRDVRPFFPLDQAVYFPASVSVPAFRLRLTCLPTTRRPSPPVRLSAAPPGPYPLLTSLPRTDCLGTCLGPLVRNALLFQHHYFERTQR
ncbi:hypothetical protein E2C01_064099 [Portunus trituberculatus]|uniref:Uncharacterized protein n=1 Tax=Portunus trituberculatus TaxID=210409 RepID=A0A5B7HKT9_PORTR|nr:hypothetical protein [Portunus trituberculatus]